MDKCVICNINKNDIIHETKYSISFVNIKSMKLGHIALASKRHVSKLADLSDNEVSDLFLQAKRLSKLINKRLNEEKIYLLYIGDKLNHFHIHLIPRTADEEKLGPFIFGEQGWKSKIYIKMNNEEKSELLAYLRKELND